MTASGGHCNPVISVDPSANGSCTISGATVTFRRRRHLRDRRQPGRQRQLRGRAPGPAVIRPVSATQTITFTSTPPDPALVGGTYTATASGGGSGNPVTFSIDPSAHGSCTIAGGTVTFVADGTCVIDANQAGNAGYQAAPQAQQSFAGPAPDHHLHLDPADPALVGGTYTVTASGGASGNPVTFTVDPSAQGTCSIAGGIVTFVAVGTCVIDANQAGNAGYQAATQVQQSFAVSAAQSITFTSTPPSATVGGATYTPAATATSGLQPGHHRRLLVHGQLLHLGGRVTFVAVGTCVIDANQAGNASYQAAPQVQQSFAVAKGTQSITFTSTPPDARRRGSHLHACSDGRPRANPVTSRWTPRRTAAAPFRRARDASSAVGTCVHRRQPGRQRQLSGRDPGPAVLHGRRAARASPSPRPRPTATVGGATYTPTATAGRLATRPSPSTPRALRSCSISGAQ